MGHVPELTAYFSVWAKAADKKEKDAAEEKTPPTQVEMYSHCISVAI